MLFRQPGPAQIQDIATARRVNGPLLLLLVDKCSLELRRQGNHFMTRIDL
jgi:hypothetical protein